MSTAVDFASRLIDPQAIKDAGHSAVIAYVSPSRPGSNFGAKPLTKEYADQLRSVGLQVVSNWQYGKPGGTAPSDWTLGFQGGVDHANQAQANHLAAGGDPAAPIYFSVDENISLSQWNVTAVEYFRGVNSVLGVQRTGVYGSSLVVAWAIQDGVVGRSTTSGKYWVWQTRAWSGGELESKAVLYQRVIDTASEPGPRIDGTAVDVNDILADDYGQWFLDRNVQGPAPAPQFEELDRLGNSKSSRNGARVTNFFLHTQEGNGTAESLAAYLNNSANGASYHYILRDRILCDVVSEQYASWSVLDANAISVNLCFAGSRASWTRDQWLEIDDDLRIAAFIAVRSAHDNGFAADVIAPPYYFGEGISDHKYVTQELGIGTHTDVGPNFPWDVFTQYVNDYKGGAVLQPKYNAIDDVAGQNPWLGARVGAGENSTPDSFGRFAQFDQGYIYWSPVTHAHPIPLDIFKKYAEEGWERGPLGYPINDPTQIVTGQVQGFEGGAIYKKTGEEAHTIWGAIRDRWNRSGFENGPLGWPTSDEKPWGDGVYQDFEHGRLYWTPSNTVGVLDTDSPLS